MRHIAILAGALATLAGFAACTSVEDVGTPESNPVLDAEAPREASSSDVVIATDAPVEARGPLCSPDGWCETRLPKGDLAVKDIWPLQEHAFAVAESHGEGIKVLEWNRADETWRFIDDNSPNEARETAVAGIVAPNDDEVYLAVRGAVYHGTRPLPPATEWKWSREALADNLPSTAPSSHRSLSGTMGLWTAEGEVYAWYLNTIFRRVGPTWSAEYVADDTDAPEEGLLILGAAGRREEAWFIGTRYGGVPCPILVRKSSDGYRRIADATSSIDSGVATCLERPGTQFLSYRSFPVGFQSLTGNELFMIVYPYAVVRLTPVADGVAYAATPFDQFPIKTPWFASAWMESEDHVWLAGQHQGTWGAVLEGSQIWEDGGSYRISTLAVNGAPVSAGPSQIRGTSRTNLWTVGDGYALHKTTP